MTSGISISNQANAELPLSPRQGEARYHFHARKRREPLDGCHASIISFPHANTLANRWVVAKQQNHHDAKSDDGKQYVCAVCSLFPSVFIEMKMRWFIRLSVKEPRLYPGDARQQENIHCLTPIEMAVLQYEQCMARHTTRRNLTLTSMKEPLLLVFYFFRSHVIIIRFTVSLCRRKIIC